MQTKATPSGCNARPPCGGGFGSAFANRGLLQDVADLLLASLAPNTQKQYTSAIAQWIRYCERRNIQVPTEGTPREVLLFLADLQQLRSVVWDPEYRLIRTRRVPTHGYLRRSPYWTPPQRGFSSLSANAKV